MFDHEHHDEEHIILLPAPTTDHILHAIYHLIQKGSIDMANLQQAVADLQANVNDLTTRIQNHIDVLQQQLDAVNKQAQALTDQLALEQPSADAVEAAAQQIASIDPTPAPAPADVPPVDVPPVDPNAAA